MRHFPLQNWLTGPLDPSLTIHKFSHVYTRKCAVTCQIGEANTWHLLHDNFKYTFRNYLSLYISLDSIYKIVYSIPPIMEVYFIVPPLYSYLNNTWRWLYTYKLIRLQSTALVYACEHSDLQTVRKPECLHVFTYLKHVNCYLLLHNSKNFVLLWYRDDNLTHNNILIYGFSICRPK